MTNQKSTVAAAATTTTKYYNKIKTTQKVKPQNTTHTEYITMGNCETLQDDYEKYIQGESCGYPLRGLRICTNKCVQYKIHHKRYKGCKSIMCSNTTCRGYAYCYSGCKVHHKWKELRPEPIH